MKRLDDSLRASLLGLVSWQRARWSKAANPTRDRCRIRWFMVGSVSVVTEVDDESQGLAMFTRCANGLHKWRWIEILSGACERPKSLLVS